REDVRDRDGACRRERLLADELHEVGDRLQQSERACTVRAVAELHAAHDLALRQGEVCEQQQDDVDDDERLDEQDPPRLGHCDFASFVGEIASVTGPLRPLERSRATSATPARSLLESCAVHSAEVRSEDTVTASPSAMP